MRLEAERINDFITNGVVTDEGLEVIAEVEVLLEALYDCPWSEGENLRKVVVLIQSQLLNANWTDIRESAAVAQLNACSYVISVTVRYEKRASLDSRIVDNRIWALRVKQRPCPALAQEVIR